MICYYLVYVHILFVNNYWHGFCATEGVEKHQISAIKYLLEHICMKRIMLKTLRGGDNRQANNGSATLMKVSFLQFTLLLIKGGCNA